MGASNRLQDLDPALLRPGRFDRQVLVGAARPRRPRGDPRGAHARQAARAGRRPRGDRAPDRRASPAPTSPTSQRGGHLRRPRGARSTSASATSTPRWSASSPASSRRSVVDREGEAHPRLPRGRARAHVAPHGRARARAEGDDRLARPRARLHAAPSRPRTATCDTKEELIDLMKVALAGRAAEQVVFGRVTNGAANDLEKVTELARAMVFEYGMSDRCHVADDARRQLRALRGDEAPARPGAGPAHRRAPSRRPCACSRSTAPRSTGSRTALLEKETLEPRRGRCSCSPDVEPESERVRDRRHASRVSLCRPS